MAGESVIKVKISVPASVLLRIQQHARTTKRTVGQLCYEGALRAIDASLVAAGEIEAAE